MLLNLKFFILTLTEAHTIFEKYHTKFDGDILEIEFCIFNNF